jgi:Ca2+-binding RTX toxin-like protein
MTTQNPNTPPTRKVIYGTEGNDTLYGSDYADEIYGRGGSDYITGGFGSDALFGEAGNDTLNGGDGNDHLDGGAGDDLILGGFGADKILGGVGFDTASYEHAWAVGVSVNLETGVHNGEAAGDIFRSIERFVGSNHSDYFNGDATANNFAGGGGNDTLSGGDGNDILDGGEGDDLLFGGTGADSFIGGSGIDTVSYQSARSGGVTVDLTTGSRGGDAIGDSFSGVERIIGTNLGDLFNGDATANIFWGGSGEDWMFGQGGNDSFEGGDGDDVIKGGAGDDYIVGGRGQDQLTGDNATGWSGADKFVISFDSGADVITDFEHGFDKIVVQGFDFGSDGTPFGSDGHLAQGRYNEDGDLEAAYLREGDELFYNTDTHQLYKIDPVYINGDVADLNAELLVTFSNYGAVGTYDFMF